jgi:hypothetical protein
MIGLREMAAVFKAMKRIMPKAGGIAGSRATRQGKYGVTLGRSGAEWLIHSSVSYPEGAILKSVDGRDTYKVRADGSIVHVKL